MSLNIRQYFRESCNKRRIHIEQLRMVRDNATTDETTRQKLNRKIAAERERLATISEIWNVS